MEEDPKAVAIIREYDRLKGERATYENAWIDIRHLVRQNLPDFRSKEPGGQVRTNRVYDGTAMQSNIDLANAVHSFLYNPANRNFGIKATARNPELNDDPDALEWMDVVSDIIASEYDDPRTMFSSALQEACLDLAFGTTIINQEWDAENGHIAFRAIPISPVFFDENKNGVVDRIYRCVEMTVRQIEQKWPDAKWEGKEDEQQHKIHKVIHAVYPRADRQYGKDTPKNMKFASCWVLCTKKVFLNEGGYVSFPYHVARWSKSDDEIYGRGPAINCLPDIRMLNRMEFTIIKAAMKAVDPPLMVPADGFLKPLVTEPGAINYKDPSAADFEVQALEHKGNFPIGEEKSEQKREHIRKCFYADWVKMMPKKERQTQLEIMELVEQQLRMMAPMLGRVQSEQLVPCIARSYTLLERAGRFPPPPQSLFGAEIEVDYVSAATIAQNAARVLAYTRLIQNMAVIQPFAPDATDALDTDYIVQDMAVLMNVPRKGIRSPQDIIEIRTARAKEQQLAAAVQSAPDLAKTALDLSKANEAGGLL